MKEADVIESIISNPLRRGWAVPGPGEGVGDRREGETPDQRLLQGMLIRCADTTDYKFILI